MASKYIQKFPIPDNFPELLNDLSKEILRNQPEDILVFCALYFKCLQEGTVLDYANRGQNIPCDFKVSTPKLSERLQRKKLANEEDEALANEALGNSSKHSKKPNGPDPVLLADEKADKDKDEAENLVNNLKAKEVDGENTDNKDGGSNKGKSVGGSGSKAGGGNFNFNFFYFFIF